MAFKLDDIFPVDHVHSNILEMANGDIAVVYTLDLPEIFTMGASDYNAFHTAFLKMFHLLPENVVVHKQDVFLYRRYDAYGHIRGDAYLQNTLKAHFDGRTYLHQQSYLSIIKPRGSLLKKTITNFSYVAKSDLSKEVKQVRDFHEDCTKSIAVLNASDIVRANVPSSEELVSYMEKYFNGFQENKIVDIDFRNGLTLGGNQFAIYALNDEESQKDGDIEVCYADNKRSSERSRFYRSYTFPLGLDLNCEHIYNQYIFYDSQSELKKLLERRVKKLKAASRFSKQNLLQGERVNNFLHSLEEENLRCCRVHTNLAVWSSRSEQLDEIDKKIQQAYASMDIVPHEASRLDAPYFYLCGVPGNGGNLPSEETFVSYLDHALCYLLPEGIGSRDDSGIMYNSRVNNIPVYIDSFEKPYLNKLIDNRNYFVIAPSGGGKSFLSKSRLQQELEMDYELVVINIGGDDKLARLYRERSVYIKYELGQTLDVNPFYIDTSVINSLKVDFLINFIGILWKPKEELNHNESSALNSLILSFYDAEMDMPEKQADFNVRRKLEDGMSIYHFYQFLEGRAPQIKEKMSRDLIDLDSLLLNLEKYSIGVYKDLFTRDKPADFENRNYIEFELDNIKDDQVLFPIFAMLIADVAFNTVWKVNGKRKDFFIDEAWLILEKPGMASLLRYLYKTIRKFDGAVGIAVQQITDLPLGAIERAILGNCSIKYLLNHKNVLADIPLLKEKLSLTEKDIALLLSIINQTWKTAEDDHIYTEFLMIMGSAFSKVFRLEVSKECAVVYDSEKTRLKKFNDCYSRSASFEEAVEQYLSTA